MYHFLNLRVTFSLTAFFLFINGGLLGQDYNTSSVFAHNDYVHPIPFYTSYYLQPGFIEADVFLQRGRLLVAHEEEELSNGRTLDSMYLRALDNVIRKNNGNVFANAALSLTLMIDLKTEGVATLHALVSEVRKYPALINCKTLRIVVSGNMPDPSLWNNFPAFIYFDGRPELTYTEEQLKRVQLISTDFASLSSWNGKGVLTETDRAKLEALRDRVHQHGKKLRFWGAPDFSNAWMILMDLNIDVIGTDNVAALTDFIRKKPKTTYRHPAPHPVYTPTYAYLKKKAAPKNIILLIGDGTGLTQLYSAFTANRGTLSIFNIRDIGFSVTQSTDSYITDSAAGATAMATGSKTNNRFVGVDKLKKPLESITEKLTKRGFSTAIISNGDITDATPAAFYAHQPERSLNENIAADFLTSNTDILIGAGTYAFRNRTDGQNIFTALQSKGYTVGENLLAMDTIRSSRFVVVDNAAGATMANGRGDFLVRALRKSLQTLSSGKKPFFVMEEGAQIDHGGHANDLPYVVLEALDFDRAAAEAMRFVDTHGETLLIITADHETGGLTLTGGDIKQGTLTGNFSTNDHTAVMVPVFAYGPGADLFRGVYPNTDIFQKMMEALRMNTGKGK